jgi:hypothetical protein
LYQQTRGNMKTLNQFTNKFGTNVEIVQIDFLDVKNNREINKNNFFLHTVANFTKVENIDFKADFISESGSKYMYTKEGVYRTSNHFSYQIGTCLWLLDSEVSLGVEVIGFCAWSDFSCYAEKENLNREEERELGLKLEKISKAMIDGLNKQFLINSKIIESL